MHYIIGPAYGRDYLKSTDAIAAFVKGVDFMNHTYTIPGRYMSVRDLKAGDTVEIRFSKLQRATLVTCEFAQAAHNNMKREQSELRSSKTSQDHTS